MDLITFSSILLFAWITRLNMLFYWDILKCFLAFYIYTEHLQSYLDEHDGS